MSACWKPQKKLHEETPMSLISCGQVQLSTNVIMTLRSQFEGGCYPLLAVYFQKYMKQKQPPEVFCEKVVFKNFAMFTGKHLCQSLFFNKVTVPSCEYCEIFKNANFEEHLRTATSDENRL